jgi:hypothetical protein
MFIISEYVALSLMYKQGKGKGKAVPVLFTEHHAMKAYWESGGITPHILDFGTRWG